MMGTELISLEPKSTAKPKLGVNNQWIQVQDPAGDQGYVAAWYVADTRAQPAAPQAMTQTGAGNLPPGALLFVPTAQLSLRTEPRVAPETLIRYIAVTEQLISLEPAQQAISKVGVKDQWLRIKDASGKEGYVAAWLVKYISGTTAQQQTTPATVMSSNGGPMKVRAAAEGVALRRQPVISDATLIKRLPLGTELTVLEQNAEAKIGRNDQWLKVKDPTGTEGVVAAWFVAR
jgi:SH3-like domain-containing protein